jgi:cytochrome c oxidase cbb3-type subunit III
MKKLFIILISLFSLSAHAQAEATSTVASNPDTFLGMPFPIGVGVMVLLAFLGFIVILLIGTMIDFGRFSYNQFKTAGKQPTGIIKLFGLFDGDYSYLTSEYQDQVIHEYDGIQEYDNDMPPWWKAGFYITATFAVVYVLIYHVFYALPLQGQEYEAELAEATVKYANIDQVYDGPITDKAKLTPVAEIFGKNCATCHGKQAEGLVGPNLTDKYWLHGGDVNKIYNTIKYGKTEKNMPAWKSKFNNEQVYELASYILSLQGSNPANPKEAQGELEK